MPKFRRLRLQDEKEVKQLMKQLTNSKVNFDIKFVLKDKHCHCLVIEDQKKIVGFGALILSIVPCRGYIGKIEDMVVDKKYRGQGLGKRLIKELLKIAKNKKISSINLTSNPERMEARKLYESMGFKLINTGVFRLVL
jgi:ribosomal protein S18 acetylase RimI-like enzyme